MKNHKKILIGTSNFDKDYHEEFNLLYKNGYEIKFNPFGRRLTEAELISILDEEYVGLLAGLEPINSKVLLNAKNLKVISRCGTGLENVDIIASEQLGIKVYNTPNAPVDSVAELNIALVLNLLRKVSILDRKIRNFDWGKVKGSLLKDKIFGQIGYGRIGKRTCDLIKGFGANVIIYDLKQTDITTSFENLLISSDIVNVSVPLTTETFNMISSKEIELMKNTALLINTSRGGIVNEHDLYDCLLKKCLGGAALDVFEEEPYKGSLLHLENIILTPHIGAYAAETRKIQEKESLKNLIEGLSLITNYEK